MNTAIRQPRARQRRDLDSAWKFALARFLRLALWFFHPELAGDIDWNRPVEFLEQEMKRLTRRARIGKRTVDMPVRVWLRSGEECWLLLHIEVQSQADERFPKRMWLYNNLIYREHGRMACSLALLTDDNPDWRPDTYRAECYGTRAEFQFPVVKLLDYRSRLEELWESNNPFAVLVAAYLEAQAVWGSHPEAQATRKIALLRRLYQQGFSRDDLHDLVEFLDWVLTLPAPYEAEFDRALRQVEGGTDMSLTVPPSRLERRMKKRLRDEVVQEVRAEIRPEVRAEIVQEMRERTIQRILSALQQRHLPAPECLVAELRTIHDLDLLQDLYFSACQSPSLEAFQSEVRLTLGA